MRKLFIEFLFNPEYFRRRYAAAWLLYLLIVGLGAVPGVRAQAGALAPGLVLHALAYSAIAYLLFTGYPQQTPARAMVCWMLIAAMGGLDEYIQTYFPYRNGRIEDWLVDVCAALTMLAFLLPGWPRLRDAMLRRL
jgi:VanZ family protein